MLMLRCLLKYEIKSHPERAVQFLYVLANFSSIHPPIQNLVKRISIIADEGGHAS